MYKQWIAAVLFVVSLGAVTMAADFSKIPNAIEKAKAGQWASYKAMGGMEQKQSITAVKGSGEDMVVTIKTEMSMAGQAMPPQEQEIALKGAKEMQQEAWKNNPNTKITEETITVNGKSFDTVVVETTQEGMSVKIYMSEKVPVTGIVKMEMQGMPGPVMELVDFGG